ncbi:GTPase domain-containing protein [Thiothrix litoralis]|uniref:GTPase domain-containing protein n=1 Tax=Thiothrix litoralis TaxID=2891210 RepID=A0ABX7WNC9_9GAMM|nr:GTPase domain-containing protein [Thiothrix litoralis]QTR44562.1 GTPase domain-containing protein [Thiothrix litoralis]
MKITQRLRWLMAGGMLLLTLLFLLFLFFATKNFLDLWDRLHQLPTWLFYTYSTLIMAVVLFSGWVIVKLVFGGPRAKTIARPLPKPVTEVGLTQEIEQIKTAGMDTTKLQVELDRLNARKAAGQVHIAFFGDISTGKSSIIKALLPEAGVEINLRGGSTRDIREYTWQTIAGDHLMLTDLPGRNEAEGTLDAAARDEAIRAQIVVYVTDSDLSRSQYQDVLELAAFGKPMLIAINKSDQYTPEEQAQLVQRIRSRFGEVASPDIVFIQSGGVEEIVRVYPDGREETVQRPRKTNVSALANHLQTDIDQRLEWLSQQRDTSVLNLVQEKLDTTRVDYRRAQAEKIVRSYTHKAILGALASVSPGTDLVIQGVIGTRMVQELCKLYDSPVRSLDIDQFLNFSQGQVKKSVPLLLAVAGNGLKAFPGIGTVAGGLVHAVAYGLIFDALGRAVTYTLEQRGTLKAAPAAATFQEMLSGNLEERTKTFARLVLEQYRGK